MLDDGEISEIWGALGDDQYGAIVKLLMLTDSAATRLLVCAGPKWTSTGRWSRCRASEPRTGDRIRSRSPLQRSRFWPLSRGAGYPKAARVIDLGYGDGSFQRWSGSKKDLDARIVAARAAKDPDAIRIMPWRLHDLRRTASTVMHDNLASPTCRGSRAQPRERPQGWHCRCLQPRALRQREDRGTAAVGRACPGGC